MDIELNDRLICFIMLPFGSFGATDKILAAIPPVLVWAQLYTHFIHILWVIFWDIFFLFWPAPLWGGKNRLIIYLMLRKRRFNKHLKKRFESFLDFSHISIQERVALKSVCTGKPPCLLYQVDWFDNSSLVRKLKARGFLLVRGAKTAASSKAFSAPFWSSFDVKNAIHFW